MNQREQILKYLKKNKKITPIDALNHFGCFRLAARIHELRCMGHKIITENGQDFAIYRMVK